MRLSPLSSQNAYASAKVAPTHTQARTGVNLKEPLPPVDFTDGETIYNFIDFLNTHVTTAIQSEHVKPAIQIMDPNLTRSIRQLDLGNGTTRLSTLNDDLLMTHAHHLFIGENSLRTYDNETPRMRGGLALEEKSNVLISANGKVSIDDNKPFHTAISDGEFIPNHITTRKANLNLLYRSLSYLYDILENPSRTTVKFPNISKHFKLLEDQNLFPQQFIDGLNGVREILKDFNPRLSYK
jgi:hypothetical protein